MKETQKGIDKASQQINASYKALEHYYSDSTTTFKKNTPKDAKYSIATYDSTYVFYSKDSMLRFMDSLKKSKN